MSDYEWHWYEPLWRRPILIDGSKAFRFAEVMRRKLRDGSWQYRVMTEQERSEKQEAYAW